jgi:peptide/nickel transport system permease protein
LPNVVAPLIVLGTLSIAAAVLVGASLSFLGLGAQPPSIDWGSMVNDGRQKLATAWWISTYPGVALMLTIIAINLVGDGARDLLDPRLRV